MTDLSRRRFLGSAGLVAAGAGLGVGITPGISLAATHGSTDTFVFVFLGGAMDGLSMLPPIGDPHYAASRPTIAVPARKAIRIDRTWGLHPRMAPLLKAWHNRDLSFVTSVGAPRSNRSHFEAQDLMERGVSDAHRAYTGWIDRHLEVQAQKGFPAIGFGDTMPGPLRGSVEALAVRDLSDLTIATPPARRARTERALADLHAGVTGLVATEARLALSSVQRLRPVVTHPPATHRGATYPATPLGAQLRSVARLLHSQVAVHTAVCYSPGWDLHTSMGGVDDGQMAYQLGDFAAAMGAFYTDMGPGMRNITVVCMSEFGRTLAENGNGGTDHGWGNLMVLMGGGVRGGVHGMWPGLGSRWLDSSGDPVVTRDYRNVLGEVLAKRMGNHHLGHVFPGFRPRAMGLVDQR